MQATGGFFCLPLSWVGFICFLPVCEPLHFLLGPLIPPGLRNWVPPSLTLVQLPDQILRSSFLSLSLAIPRPAVGGFLLWVVADNHAPFFFRSPFHSPDFLFLWFSFAMQQPQRVGSTVNSFSRHFQQHPFLSRTPSWRETNHRDTAIAYFLKKEAPSSNQRGHQHFPLTAPCMLRV